MRLLAVSALGIIPLLVIRLGDEADDLLVPLVGSLALAAVCTSAVTWLLSIAVSGAVVLTVYRQRPALMSQKVAGVATESFGRISSFTSDATLVALVAGLLALAIGLPTRAADDQEHSVIEDLLTSQVACLLVLLAFSFLSEAIRTAVDIVDDQSELLAWPWALVISTLSLMVASVAGPFEITAIITRLLAEWLPAEVNGRARAQVIADLIPAQAHRVTLMLTVPVMIVLWVFEAVRHGGLAPLRRLVIDPVDDIRQ